MKREIRLWELVAMALMVFACFAFMATALYEATWLPMSDNYHQCGRIFLCPAQR